MRRAHDLGLFSTALATACALACTSPLEDRVIACTPGEPSTCPDGWRCRLDDAGGEPRCFRSGPALPREAEAPPDAGTEAGARDADLDAARLDAGTRDAALDATPLDAGSRDAGLDATPLDAGVSDAADAGVPDVPDSSWPPPIPGVGSLDADPPDGFTRATCRPEWERLLRISYSAADLEGSYCERPNDPDDHGIGYCGYATLEECQCNWLGRLRGDFHCEPRPAELHCMWSRRCGSPRDDPTQRRIACVEHRDECIDIVRGWSDCALVLLTPEEDACGAPADVPAPASGEAPRPLPECCHD